MNGPDEPTPATPAPFLPTARERLTDAGLRTASKGISALGRMTDRVGERVRRRLDERSADQDPPAAPHGATPPTTPPAVQQPVAPPAHQWAVPGPVPHRHSQIVPLVPVPPVLPVRQPVPVPHTAVQHTAVQH